MSVSVCPLNRTKSSVAFKTRHRPVPITPCRTTSLLRHCDVARGTQTHGQLAGFAWTQTHGGLAGKAYTLPRRQRQHPSPLQSFAGYSTAACTPPPVVRSDAVTVWLGGEEDVNVVERLDPSAAAARCTCTMRRVVAATSSGSAPPSAAVLRGLTAAADGPSSFTTFKPAAAASTSTGDLPRSSVSSDCAAATFYDRPPSRDDSVGGGGTDYFPQCRASDRLAS